MLVMTMPSKFMLVIRLPTDILSCKTVFKIYVSYETTYRHYVIHVIMLVMRPSSDIMLVIKLPTDTLSYKTTYRHP